MSDGGGEGGYVCMYIQCLQDPIRLYDLSIDLCHVCVGRETARQGEGEIEGCRGAR